MRRRESEPQNPGSDPAYELSPGGKTLLQKRLATEGLAVSVLALAYFATFYFTWRAHPGLSDARVLSHVLSPWTYALISLHLLLWLATRGRRLPSAWLPSVDIIYHAAVGAAVGGVIYDHPAAAIAPLEGVLAVTASLGVRALLVPSSGARTALVGVVSALGPGLPLFVLPAHFTSDWMGVRTTGPLYVTWALVAVVLTSVASIVQYGLRRQIREARRLGQYSLVEHLGSGGMGVVYRAEHALLRRPTAVKLLRQTSSPDRIARFEREVQLMAELTHQNTVAIYDYGRTADGVFYYAMEYLDGIDLEALVEMTGPQTPGRVIHLLRQACGSLEEAHRRGLIHRDVKPANLFLCQKRSEPDTVKVLDFGLVRNVGTEGVGITVADAVLGTPLYMPPEAISSPGAVDARSDLYSLGAVAYFLLTGTPVFSGKTMIEVCGKHLHEEPESLSARLGSPIPSDLESLVLACLAKERTLRPSSAGALRNALGGCADIEPWSEQAAQDWWDAHATHLKELRSARGRDGRSVTTTVAIDFGRKARQTPLTHEEQRT